METSDEKQALTPYEKIFQFDALMRAHTAARKGKQHKQEVIFFEMNLCSRITELQHQLQQGTYRVGPYYAFDIFEPKRRTVFATHYEDRVVLHALCDEILIPLIQPRLIYDNAACQPNKGTHFAMDRLTKFMRAHYRQHGATGYMLKCDIRKYFNNIDHDVLKARLHKILHDPQLTPMLDSIIDSYHTEGLPNKGLPLGNQTSQWFALYYCDPLDRLIKEKLGIRHYVRYMDDLILLHPSKEYLAACLAQMRTFIQDELLLEFNERTQIFPLQNGAHFLGFHFYLTSEGKVIRILRAQTKIRAKRHLHFLKRRYAKNGAVDLEHIQQVLASYRGHIRHGHTYRLWKKMLNEFVLCYISDAPTAQTAALGGAHPTLVEHLTVSAKKPRQARQSIVTRKTNSLFQQPLSVYQAGL